ncbi:MAG: transglutaminase domain-containing protein, partial [Bdellovibrionota bacterium]
QEESPYFDPSSEMGLWVSTQSDWSKYASALIPVHEALVSEKLPGIVDEIATEAATKKTDLEKIEFVAARVAQEFRYFGDWRRRHGGYIPRSLGEIAQSRYGDCKDLSLVVTAVYRALGMKADLAWIWRGEIAPPKMTYELPIDTAFNHAVARVETGGNEYWVDATNPVSYARTPWPDIAGRQAFLLDAKNPRLVSTPALSSKASSYITRMRFTLKKDDTFAVNGDIELKERAAIGLNARAFYQPLETVNYEIIRG